MESSFFNCFTVVLNKQDYEDKLNAMLEDGTYKKLKKDPTSKVEREIGEALKECEKKGNMTRECRLRLTPRASVPPQLMVCLRYTRLEFL